EFVREARRLRNIAWNSTSASRAPLPLRLPLVFHVPGGVLRWTQPVPLRTVRNPVPEAFFSIAARRKKIVERKRATALPSELLQSFVRVSVAAKNVPPFRPVR